MAGWPGEVGSSNRAAAARVPTCRRRRRSHPRQLLAWVVLASLPPRALGHLTTVCTVSAASEHGKVHFMLGTYHGSINNQGDIRIVQPSGAELSFPLNDDCDPSSSPSRRGEPTEAHLTSSASCGFPADAIATCYGGELGSESGALSDPRRTKVVTGTHTGSFSALGP